MRLFQELMVPMNDIDIYDGETIDGSFEAKSKNNWVQILDMIDLTFNNLQQQNKELKRTVNELSSKVNKVYEARHSKYDLYSAVQMVFHERKEESKSSDAKVKKATTEKPSPEYNQSQVQVCCHILKHFFVTPRQNLVCQSSCLTANDNE